MDCRLRVGVLASGALLVAVWAGGCSSQNSSDDGASSGGAGASGTGGVESVCPGSQVLCGSACVDLDSNPTYCGACDNPCSAGQVCSFGECGEECDAGLTPCDSACVDLMRSVDHCGACGISCAESQECSAGSCVERPFNATGGTGTGGLGTGASGATTTGGDAGVGGGATGGVATGGNAAGGNDTGGTGTGGALTGGASTGGATGVDPLDVTLTTVVGKTTIGLEWPRVEGALSYNLYWSTTAGLTTSTATRIEGAQRGYVHEGLSDGTTYHYAVTAVTAAGESPLSPEVEATPGGSWVLEELGTGDFDDVVTGAPVATVPVTQRIHVLLFAEGYTPAETEAFFRDVDDWVDLVFGIEPYSLFPQAFVVWSLPAESATTIRDSSPSTAFHVPVDVASSSTFAYMNSVSTSGETAALAWAAIDEHPYVPTDFTGPGNGRARNATGAFLIYDPARGEASVSGLTTTLLDPNDNSRRIATAFGVGHAHEFSHAFGLLRDEYLENDNQPPSSWDGTSNVAGTNVCSELPWAHLLYGSALNPDVDQLVGAFGTPAHGYHSELLCLINGTHDNGEYYSRDDSGSCSATSCTLRSEDRLCNFCRETVALRVFQRAGILDVGSAGFDVWVAEYRQPFYERFGFAVPDPVPQSNDVRNPAQGTPIFEACVP